MEILLSSIRQKKTELDQMRPISSQALQQLQKYYDIELTYTSNAIEGNTLNAAETTLVIEKGITVGGKSLKDHLEAVDHYEAIRYVREIAQHPVALTERDIRALHHLVVQRSRPEIAGRYASHGRYVLTDKGRYAFPSPTEIPALMGAFAAWLAEATDTPETAFAAHRELVTVHPFDDGNGRTARLLMNLILIRAGYPPVAVRPQDRLSYIEALQKAQAGHGAEDFDRLLYQRLDATLDEYLSASKDALPKKGAE